MSEQRSQTKSSFSSSPKSEVEKRVNINSRSKSPSKISSIKEEQSSDEKEFVAVDDKKQVDDSSAENDQKNQDASVKTDPKSNHEDISAKRELLK